MNPSPVPALLTLLNQLVAPACSLAAGAGLACQAGLLAYSAQRGSLLLGVRAPVPDPPPPGAWPRVTVQLPVWNEPRVVERVIAAACSLDYPRERLEIQVLDDSDDETVALAAAAVARARECGLDIRHLRRGRRVGFKAGALAAGLVVATGELIAVFDADFVPPPGFLRRIVRRFADPRVGLVQARCGHLNDEASLLTRAQAVLLDAHFLVEHAARMSRGLFFNFNGTAGVWRRTCIEEAGGWSGDTLTEDLDLSYRAQLAGWRFVFDPGVVVPGELPADMSAVLAQQDRWTRGSIQVARKLLPALLRRPLPVRVKLEAFFHLTAGAAYPLLLALAVLWIPVVVAESGRAAGLASPLAAAMPGLGLAPIAWFLAAGQRAAGARWWQLPGRVVAAMLLATGLVVHNSVAVARGLGGPAGSFARTPKSGACGRIRARALPGARPHAGVELALATLFAAMGLLAARAGDWRALPLFALLAIGLGWVGGRSLPRVRRGARRERYRAPGGA